MSVLTSATGVELTRNTAYKFRANPNPEQALQFFRYAGASRTAYNQCLGHVNTNYQVRRAEREAGTPPEHATPAVSWSKFSFINYINAYKNGTTEDSPTEVGEDGTVRRGWTWASEVCADVFETAAVDAAAAYANASRTGHYPRFKAKHHTTPSFRLRNRKAPTAPAQDVRVTGVRTVRLPKLGEVAVFGSTKRLRRAISAGRFHIQSVTIKLVAGTWEMTVAGIAAVFHPQRRRPPAVVPVGVDRGVRNRVVAATENREVVYQVGEVNFTEATRHKVGMLQQLLARTKPGSRKHRRLTARIARLHRKARNRREHLLHHMSNTLLDRVDVLVVEGLAVAPMVARPAPVPDGAGGFLPNGAGRKARHNSNLHDAAMGKLGRILGYKAGWFGRTLLVEDRWFASTQTCSQCGGITPVGSDTVYRCRLCGLVVDRDVNAAANLAGRAKHLQPV